MKSLSQIASKLEGVVVKAINEGECYAENDKKNFYLRPSSFPYCPLRFFLGLPKAFSRGKYEEASFSYYVRVGSATHAVIQEAVTSIEAGSALFVRDWVCQSCEHRHVLVPKPETCKKCEHKYLRNEEFILEDGLLLGHVDDAMKIGSTIYPLDYKTTSQSRMERRGVLPEKKHIEQLGAYASVMKRQGKNIGGFFLVYLSRDNPRKVKVFPFELTAKFEQDALAKIDKWKKQHRKVLAIESEDDLAYLVNKRICRKAEDVKAFCGECKYARACTNSDEVVQAELLRTFKRIHKHLPVKGHISDARN
jgi:rubrerythrin